MTLRLAAGIGGWAIRLIAAAMVACIAVEACRAGIKEGLRFSLPAAIGFLAGFATLVLRQRLWAVWERFCAYRWALGLIVLLPCAAQIIFVLVVQTEPTSDYAAYWSSAKRLWHHGEYAIRIPVGGILFRALKPPGMALFLAPFYGLVGSPLAAQCANLGLVLAGNLVFYRLLCHRTGRAAAMLATALLALWPSRSFCVGLLGYDPPASFLLLCFWYLAERPHRQRAAVQLAAGVTAGVAVLVRVSLLAPFAIFFAYLYVLTPRFKTWARSCVWLAVGLAVVLGAWAHRNHRVLGETIFTGTQGGFAIYNHYHPRSPRHYKPVGWGELISESQGDEVRFNTIGWQGGLEFIRQDPARALWRVASSLYTLLESDHEIAGLALDTASGPLSTEAYWMLRSVACGVCDVWYAWMSLCALLASASAVRVLQAKPLLLWPVGALAVLIAFHATITAIPRYMVTYQCLWAAVVAACFQASMTPGLQNEPQPIDRPAPV